MSKLILLLQLKKPKVLGKSVAFLNNLVSLIYVALQSINLEHFFLKKQREQSCIYSLKQT